MKQHIKNEIKTFLENTQFQEYMLFRTKEQEAYWEGYVKENPDKSAVFELAKTEFGKLKISVADLSKEELAHIYNQVMENVYAYKKQAKIKKLYQYASAAAVFALLLVSTYFYINRQPAEDTVLSYNNIIGMQLPEEKVYLLSSNEIIKLNDNSNLNVSEKGEISLVGSESKDISLKKADSSVNTLVVPYGKRSFITLSDGSRAWVNSGSRITFPTVFDEDKRTINVEGEVYFEVEKMPEKPFIVQAKNMKIQVYGTSFNISAYVDDTENSVVLVEGSVKVSTAKSEVMLEPNKRAALRDNEIDIVDANVDDYISWKNGYLVLKKESLGNVLKRMERYYNMSFSNKSNLSLFNEQLSGKLYLSNSIDSVMNSLSSIYSFSYDKRDNIISISK